MGKRLGEEIRLKAVREALAGIKVGALARMYDVHPETIRGWIRDHRDDVAPEEIPMTDEHMQELQRLQEIEAKYEKAMKILGEKELENEILRELIKKRNPAYPKSTK
ncbi:transposase [Paenibacillus sp. LMG 31458]|uniref:Transposase n=1 Tax=Paenibacillus phytorum TaxID=2654977 RepID=A0ABX1Y0A9_9BACL|nr:transposase [Paenibacillus phytorum]NOU74267.1 transposase [Paenibacillus phytorum]